MVTADAHVIGSVVGPNGEALPPWSIRVEVRDQDGRGDEGPLRDDGSFYYTDDELQRRGVNEDDLSPAYFSTTTNSWTKVESYVVDRDANRLTVQINHLSTWALTSSTGTPAAPEPEGEYKIYLPLIVKIY